MREKPYPNVWNYDSDYDYYLDCINHSQSSVKAHYEERKKEAIKVLNELSNKIDGILETYKFEYDIEDDLIEHLDEIEKILDGAEPTKVVEL